MRLTVWCEQAVQVNSLVPLTATFGIGRIVNVGADGDQATLVPILDGGLVRRSESKAAALVIDIVGSHERGPLAGLLLNLVREPQGGPEARTSELAAHQSLILTGAKALKIVRSEEHTSELQSL